VRDINVNPDEGDDEWLPESLKLSRSKDKAVETPS